MSSGSRLFLIITGTLFSIVLVAVALSGRIGINPAKSELKKSRNQAEAAIYEFMGKELDLEVLGKFEVPIGTVYEVATRDRHSFFHVSKKSREVIYADIGGIDIRPADKEMIGREEAKKIAVKYAGRHRQEFKGFILAEEQADFFWPKPTYWTFVWYSSPDNVFEFAKVTVDAESGDVVAYGKGGDTWTTFCLPDRAQAAWASDRKI